MSERTEDTIELLKTQLLVQPNNPSKRYMLGKAYAKIGDFPSAIDNLKRAVRFNDEYGNAYYRLGLAYFHTDAIAEAATAFEGAVKHGAKEIIPAWYHLATTRRQLEQFAEAAFHEEERAAARSDCNRQQQRRRQSARLGPLHGRPVLERP